MEKKRAGACMDRARAMTGCDSGGGWDAAFIQEVTSVLVSLQHPSRGAGREEDARLPEVCTGFSCKNSKLHQGQTN